MCSDFLGASNNLSFAILTSLKIWTLLYFIYFISLNIVVHSLFLLTLLVSFCISLILLKYQLRQPNPSNVAKFFNCADGLMRIGHRGASQDAPENSLGAFRYCKSLGFSAVEFDVSVTKDNVPVVFHDSNLMRIGGINRELKDMTWGELRQVDISKCHPNGHQFPNERVPKLEEVIDLCLHLGLKFFIDLKDDNPYVVDAIVKAFQKPGMYSMGIVSSFYPKAIFDIRRQDGDIIGCMAHRPGYFRYRKWNPNWRDVECYHSGPRDFLAQICDRLNDWALDNFYPRFLALSAIVFNKDSISKEKVHRWIGSGVNVFVAVVNTEPEKRHFLDHFGVGFMTDCLSHENNTST